MEHPHDPYHVRPFPQQPHRGGKALKKELQELEKSLIEMPDDLERIRGVQAQIHNTANGFNDDLLVDHLRRMSHKIDDYLEKPEKENIPPIMEHLLQILVELKHL